MINFFEKYPEIVAIMSEKKDGSMRLFCDGVLDKNNARNRKKYFNEIGIKYDDVVAAYLVSGANVEVIEGSKEKIIPRTDSLITKKRGIYLSCTAADCVPILFYETKLKIIGIAHAGWRGAIQEITKKTISRIEDLGGKPENVAVAMGPGIGKCHLEIGEDTIKKFENYSEFIEEKRDKFFVDLKGIIKKQLLESRIKRKNIEDISDCTFCNEKKYYSYRRDNMQNSGLMIAMIGRK